MIIKFPLVHTPVHKLYPPSPTLHTPTKLTPIKCTITPKLLPITLLLIVLPLTNVNSAIKMCVFALTVSLVVVKFTLINISVRV